MTAYTKRGFGPPKPNTTPDNPVLDRFGLALAGEYILATVYTDDIPGLPINVDQGISTQSDNAGILRARSALLGVNPPVNGLSGAIPYDNYADATTETLTNIGARIIHLAQCVREAGLCSEYLEYTTLPPDNNSGIFDSTWAGTGDRYIGDLKVIYDDTIATLPYTATMFSDEDRDQYDNNPLIPFRLAYYIRSFMDTFYKIS